MGRKEEQGGGSIGRGGVRGRNGGEKIKATGPVNEG